MSYIHLIKKLLPKTVKEKIKSELSGSTVYDLNVLDQGRLKNKTVIVTGGSGAIGSAICFRLAMEGAIVGVCGRSIEKINMVIDNIQKNGGKAVPIVSDVTDRNTFQKAIDDFYKEFGGIHILVNNAGGSARGDSTDFSSQDFEVIKKILSINLIGTMQCTHVVLPYMKQDGFGRIINMSSIVGLQGKSGMTDYAASKAGIIGFTRSLAIELGKFNITVNAISPGYVNQTVFDRGRKTLYANINCMGHNGRTDDIAGTVAWLVSEDANYVTGQNIIVDGGRSLGLWGDN
ncbi:SDR family NAD(P)-dependent oxidoreductase [Butyrivibrio sp. MC2013]|uniref:SDR family NAD(P)-dependent oxidoreductase n=1 Tax=Butyrivibrio sp. MC2013 TaxID=1280686 RepID=UPI00040EA246|nr:SDR family NAD(P)-dependent oxidoreductase [Butyrivibrio sp. MC2013]